MTICAIHQPNFFPWLGFFDKIKRCDHFIFLDSVAYPKSGSGAGSWTNRVHLQINNEPRWAGCPIKREPGIQLIQDVTIDDNQPWRKKLLRTLEFNYKKSKNYKATIDFLEPLILSETQSLAEFNINAIKTISQFLNLGCEFHLQSELKTEGQSNALLVNLTKAVNATTYLCGGGANGYQDDDYFKQHNIEINYQHFEPKAYDKLSSHTLGLSIIDFLMKADKWTL